jgi:surface protein
VKHLLSLLILFSLILGCGTENNPTFTISVTVSGSGTVSPSSGQYSKGEEVVVTATPNTGWRFVRWEGDWSGETNPLSLVVKKNYTIVGVFTENPVYLSENGVTIKCPNGKAGQKGYVNEVEYEIVDRDLLVVRIKEGKDLSKVCVSSITNMSVMFKNSQFNQPIGNWDVSSVTNMYGMFSQTPFNQPIGNWDVSSVTNMRDMSRMFEVSQFNQPINNWCVTKITSEPNNFSSFSPLTPQNKPIWGTCPTR